MTVDAKKHPIVSSFHPPYGGGNPYGIPLHSFEADIAPFEDSSVWCRTIDNAPLHLVYLSPLLREKIIQVRICWLSSLVLNIFPLLSRHNTQNYRGDHGFPWQWDAGGRGVCVSVADVDTAHRRWHERSPGRWMDGWREGVKRIII